MGEGEGRRSVQPVAARPPHREQERDPKDEGSDLRGTGGDESVKDRMQILHRKVLDERRVLQGAEEGRPMGQRLPEEESPRATYKATED